MLDIITYTGLVYLHIENSYTSRAERCRIQAKPLGGRWEGREKVEEERTLKFHSDLVKGEWLRSFCASKQNSVGANTLPAPHTTFWNLNIYNVLQQRRNRERRNKPLMSTTPAREESTKHSLVGKPRRLFGIFLLFLSRVLNVWIEASRATHYSSTILYNWRL